ncbi:hypothetical protein M2M59_04040 [Rummeliibacillus sp. G93]|uniref:phage baseplate plug family protein n=1 Tax=unclassified Rummeliibacillus TaxID=2622809 RepID=UPI00123BDAE6|nr:MULTISPECIES: hypothetical protein [unclassified Rummeliibacillus]UQW98188.1 hypothetical protein M2M59_04040 [Rummeliibacillus sp. G93]
MDKEYIEIEKDLIPYEFEIELEEEIFTFDVRYNENHDFFTIDLYKDEELICAGEKLVYGVPLWEDITTSDFPAPTIIPLDPSGKEKRVSWDNLNTTVFLILDNQGEEDE